jgi:hypothetical protein
VWIALQRNFGFKAKYAIERLAQLRTVYSTEGNGTIDTAKMLHAILDEISNMVTLEEIPEMSAYIADKIIELSLYNFVIQGISLEENFKNQEYSMILYNLADEAAAISLKVKTDEWNSSQVLLPSSDLPPKATRYILPLWDGSTFKTKALNRKEKSESVQAPQLFLTEIDFSSNEILADEKVPGEQRSFRIVDYVTLNACGDGSEKPNYLILDRASGPMSSLSSDDGISQISIKSVYPWILGKRYPEDSNMRLEDRHWPWVYITTQFEKPDVSTSDIREASLVKLKPFTGSRYYLFDPARMLLPIRQQIVGQSKKLDLMSRLYERSKYTLTEFKKR